MKPIMTNFLVLTIFLMFVDMTTETSTKNQKGEEFLRLSSNDQTASVEKIHSRSVKERKNNNNPVEQAIGDQYEKALKSLKPKRKNQKKTNNNIHKNVKKQQKEKMLSNKVKKNAVQKANKKKLLHKSSKKQIKAKKLNQNKSNKNIKRSKGSKTLPKDHSKSAKKLVSDLKHNIILSGISDLTECPAGQVKTNGKCKCKFLSQWNSDLHICKCIYGTYMDSRGNCVNYF